MVTQPSILIADDDAGIRETLADILQDKGYEVESAKDAQEAAAKARGKTYNLAIIDVRLPDGEGTKLLAQIKEMHPLTEVIIITGSASLESSLDALHRGAFAYVMKPLNPEEVLNTIGRALERQRLTMEKEDLLARSLKDREYYWSLAIRDELTGLHNRRHFQELLRRELATARRYSQPLTLLLIDIDHFKNYNDTLGHPAGDEALKTIARTLSGSSREADLVARYGGEEFALLLPQTNRAQGAAVAERLRLAVETTPLQGLPSGLTISTGVASFPQDAQNSDELILKADHALYQAKRLGRNRTCLWEPGS